MITLCIASGSKIGFRCGVREKEDRKEGQRQREGQRKKERDRSDSQPDKQTEATKMSRPTLEWDV